MSPLDAHGAAILREITDHSAECTARFCWRCGREACSDCRTAVADRRLGTCRGCQFARADREIGIPARFGWSALGSELLAHRVARGRAAIAEAARGLDASGMVLCGATGCGKTSLAVAALRALLARDWGRPRTVLRFVPALALGLARAEHPLGQGAPRLVTTAIRATVLVLDDLGAEPARYADAIVEVIHARHDAGRPTWVTTWLDVDGVAGRFGGSIARRLFEGAIVVRCDAGGGR